MFPLALYVIWHYLLPYGALLNKLIYTLMGNQVRSRQHLTVLKKSNIQQQYLTKLFIKNKKSNKRFKEQLASICKRSSYLQYKWTQELLQELNTTNFNRLYTEYQTILKENCLREGQKEKIFCPANIQTQFIKQFTDRLNTPQLHPSLQVLKQAFEQCKCYFMVMSWLHKIVTLSANDKQNKGRIICDWDQSQQQHIFTALISLSLKTYRTRTNVILQKAEFGAKMNQSNMNICKLIKRIMVQNLKFVQKEQIIAKIQEQLQVDSNHLNENILYLRSIAGSDQIFAYLTTIKQVGHIDITFLCQHLEEQLQ